ncbi:hypothetical protein KCTCHS21_29970 [Cohnella abietis]|uniref:DUF6602 domain-containing protein n=1 Tax=Cohnella abietis TaxID=2507935 RepID=A0A3T1D693_9BACL|nr:hypothetical protein KCTCHS21_29970 [Cohnella abietis]
MPNYLEYQKSIASEFKAYEKRVRHLIDDAHWVEEGRYKEIILMNYLKRILPKHISVGTGFIRNQDTITHQIDIIIYDNTYPLLFSEGDFIIAVPENVIGIIEVKSNIVPSDLCDIIKKSNHNASIICGNSNKMLFNGVFSYNSIEESAQYILKLKTIEYKQILEKQFTNQIISNKLSSCVNHIVLGTKYFIKLWASGVTHEKKHDEWKGAPPHYSFYNMQEGLAFSYFLSNLQEVIIRKLTGKYVEELSGALSAYFYPIPEGKEARLVERIELR